MDRHLQAHHRGRQRRRLRRLPGVGMLDRYGDRRRARDVRRYLPTLEHRAGRRWHATAYPHSRVPPRDRTDRHGRVIDAREAERIGLVNEVVPSGTCLQRAGALADSIFARTPPRSRPASPARSKQLPSESSLPDGRAAFACCSPARGRYSATLSLTKGSAVSDNSRAYNSVWQLRTDAWCRLEEASERLTKPTTNGELKEEYVTICRDLLATLTPLEPYWAHPGTPQARRSSPACNGCSRRAATTSSPTPSRGSIAHSRPSRIAPVRSSTPGWTNTTCSEPTRVSSSTSPSLSAISRTSRCWSSSR